MDRLESLLQQWAWDGPKTPQTPDCFDIHTILTIIDRPDEVRAEDWRHLENCRFCLRSVLRVRRDREVIEAPLSDEELSAGRGGVAAEGSGLAVGPMDDVKTVPLQFPRWLTMSRAVLGAAAIVLVAIGVGWWLSWPRVRGPTGVAPVVLAALTVEPVQFSHYRGGGEPQRKGVEVSVRLAAEAHVAVVYLDHRRQLQVLPFGDDAEPRTVALGPGTHAPRPIDVTGDPAGPQWIGAVASVEPFDAAVLRDALQATVRALPSETPLNKVMDRLDADLRARPGFSVKSERFTVSAGPSP